MPSGRFVAYYRVSTDKQGRSGLGLDAQRRTVEGYLDGGDWRLVSEHVEVESGKRADRPELARALADCRVHNAVLCIANIFRLARNVHFISGLMESGVEFVAADMPTVNKLTIHILAAVAEEEARLVSTRTKLALQAARTRGVVLGRPGNLTRNFDLGRKRSAAKRAARAEKRSRDLIPVIDDIRRGEANSFWRIAAALNERGVPTPMSRRWSATQVRRVVERIPGYEATRRGSCGDPTAVPACKGGRGGPAPEAASAGTSSLRSPLPATGEPSARQVRVSGRGAPTTVVSGVGPDHSYSPGGDMASNAGAASH